MRVPWLWMFYDIIIDVEVKHKFQCHMYLNKVKTSLKSLRLRDLLTFAYLCFSLVTFGYPWPYWALLGLTRIPY